MNLHGAVENNDISLVKQFIVGGADVNGLHYTVDVAETPLQIASMHGFVECCSVLIEAKADVNKSDYKGNTPLHRAAHNVECVKVPGGCFFF